MEQIKIAEEHISIKGHLAIIELPHDMSDEELADWLNPVTGLGDDGLYHVVKPAKISQEERARRTVLEADNLITNTGIKTILSNLSVPGQGDLIPFAQIFAVGNGAIPGILPTDTAVPGDGFATNSRQTPSGSGTVGWAYTNMTINFASGDAVGTWTNVGLFGTNPTTGQAATTTASTGSLMTHALCPFVKGSSAVAVMYYFMYATF